MSRMGMLINLVFITISNGFKWKDSTHLASAVCWPKQDLLTFLNLGHEPISRAISSNLILQDPIKIELGGGSALLRTAGYFPCKPDPVAELPELQLVIARPFYGQR